MLTEWQRRMYVVPEPVKVSYRNTDGAHHCDECNAKFFYLDPQPGKITYTPMPEMATLRDQFAMAALNGMLADPQVQAHQSTAGLAYQMADWMMESRE
jgi:hypothetical protein